MYAICFHDVSPFRIASDILAVTEWTSHGSSPEVAAAGVNPQFLEIEKRLDKVEKQIEFVDAEVAQRIGRKIGRDIGILYGLVAGLVIFYLLNILRFI
jgi:tetrahydromethanopterin S-methyltransferase subunit A